MDGNGTVDDVGYCVNNVVQRDSDSGGKSSGPVNAEQTISPSAITDDLQRSPIRAGTPGSTAVSTQGVAGLDFYDAGGGTGIAQHGLQPRKIYLHGELALTLFLLRERATAVGCSDGGIGALLATGRLVVELGACPHTTVGGGVMAWGHAPRGVHNTMGIASTAPVGWRWIQSSTSSSADSNNNVLLRSSWRRVTGPRSIRWCILSSAFPMAMVVVDGGGSVDVADTSNDAAAKDNCGRWWLFLMVMSLG